MTILTIAVFGVFVAYIVKVKKSTLQTHLAAMWIALVGLGLWSIGRCFFP